MLSFLLHKTDGNAHLTQDIELTSYDYSGPSPYAHATFRVPIVWLADMGARCPQTSLRTLSKILKHCSVCDVTGEETIEDLTKELELQKSLTQSARASSLMQRNLQLEARVKELEEKLNRRLPPTTVHNRHLEPTAVRSRVREAIFIRVFENELKCGVPPQAAAEKAREAAIIASVVLEPTP